MTKTVKPTKQQIEAAISRAMGDGEDTPEVNGTIAVATDLVERAYRAGIDTGIAREKARKAKP